MKTFIYGMRDSDNMCGMVCQSSHKHFIAEQIEQFYKKVGQYQPVTWLIYGEMETVGGKITIYDEPEVFDYEKQLSEDLAHSSVNNGVDTSTIAQEIEVNADK